MMADLKMIEAAFAAKGITFQTDHGKARLEFHDGTEIEFVAVHPMVGGKLQINARVIVTCNKLEAE